LICDDETALAVTPAGGVGVVLSCAAVGAADAVTISPDNDVNEKIAKRVTARRTAIRA